jgi:hypothetical protein
MTASWPGPAPDDARRGALAGLVPTDREQPSIMAFKLSLASPDLPGLEDDLCAGLSRLWPEVEATVARWDLPGVLDRLDLGGLDDLAALAGRFPAPLGGPDATGEVPTGGGATPGFGREELAVLASLAAAPRIAEALGPQAQTFLLRGEAFTIAERYEDPETGFSALRLTPVEPGAPGGAEIFAIDGLQVGSPADAVAAATIGRLQVDSDVFRAMIQDAASLGAAGGEVAFVGPSLGGAIAQVAAYETAEALLAAGAAPGFGDVQLVTVDPLGGADAARAINAGALDPAALAVIEALNLRTEGDLVSRIGSHLGPTLTLPGRDAAGEVVALTPAAAHVNAVSLLRNLSDDAFFATGVPGAPAEISGFAAASNAAADEAIALWRLMGATEDAMPQALQIRGASALDATRTLWSLDADADGGVDLAVALSSPLDPTRDDLVLV